VKITVAKGRDNIRGTSRLGMDISKLIKLT
jgi:hypothetical protein